MKRVTDVEDDREALGYPLTDELEARGGLMDHKDLHALAIRITRDDGFFAGYKPQSRSNRYDFILMAAAHDEYRQPRFQKSG